MTFRIEFQMPEGAWEIVTKDAKPLEFDTVDSAEHYAKQELRFAHHIQIIEVRIVKKWLMLI